MPSTLCVCVCSVFTEKGNLRETPEPWSGGKARRVSLTLVCVNHTGWVFVERERERGLAWPGPDYCFEAYIGGRGPFYS